MSFERLHTSLAQWTLSLAQLSCVPYQGSEMEPVPAAFGPEQQMSLPGLPGSSSVLRLFFLATRCRQICHSANETSLARCMDACMDTTTERGRFGCRLQMLSSSRASDELVKLMKSRVTHWDPGDATPGLRQKCRPEAQAGSVRACTTCVFTDVSKKPACMTSPGPCAATNTIWGTCSC